MGFNETLVLIHVLAAVVWVGGAVMLEVLGTKALLAGDDDGVLKVIRDSEWIGLRVFMPASIILLAAGIWLVIRLPWEFSDTWVTIGFSALIISAIAGAAFFGPEAARIAAAADEKGSKDAAVARRIKRFVLVSRIDLLVLIVAVWAMVTRPGA